jgi:hypothetical protein
MNRKWILTCLLFLACLSLPICGFAQAWVSPKGTGAISLSYQNNFIDKHLFGTGQDFLMPGGVKTSDLGQVRQQSTFVDVGYSFTNRLAINVSLPYIESKYTAPLNPPVAGFGPHALADGTIPLDDGHYHGSFQDFNIRVRYNVWTHPLVITPFIEYVTPSNGYMFYSHAVVGNHVRELKIGTYIGSTLNSFLPNAYIQGRYAYGFPQEILGISRTRQNAELEMGYFFSPVIHGFGILIGQVTNGGVNLPTDVSPLSPTNPLFFHHTQISRDNILDIAGGVGYSLSNSVDLYGVVTHTITARNMHAVNYGLTFAIGWGFGGSPQRPCHC